MEKFNQEQVEEMLEWLPEAFVAAHRAGKEAQFDDIEAGDWVPWFDEDYDEEDPQGWKQTAYAQQFRTEGGKLYCEVHSVDTDGNWDFDDEAEIGTPEYDELLNTYFDCNKNCAAEDEYADWCLEYGDDPLGMYFVSMTKRVEEHWTFRFQFIDGKASFVGAYKDGKVENIKPYAKLDKESKRIARSGDTETVKKVIAGDIKADREVTCVSDGVYDIVVTHHVEKRMSKKRYIAALRKIIRRNK